MNIKEEIKNYIPYNEKEENDKALILRALDDFPDVFNRTNPICHMTASAWVTNKDHTKILMAFHNIYNSYSWLGGHADGNENLLEVAIKEVKEESGINNVTPVTDKIFSIESLTVDGHIKNDKYVSSHLHLNVTYLLCADENEELHIKKDENSSVRWFDINEAVEASNEKWFKDNVYSKLNKKMGEYYENN